MHVAWHWSTLISAVSFIHLAWLNARFYAFQLRVAANLGVVTQLNLCVLMSMSVIIVWYGGSSCCCIEITLSNCLHCAIILFPLSEMCLYSDIRKISWLMHKLVIVIAFATKCVWSWLQFMYICIRRWKNVYDLLHWKIILQFFPAAKIVQAIRYSSNITDMMWIGINCTRASDQLNHFVTITKAASLETDVTCGAVIVLLSGLTFYQGTPMRSATSSYLLIYAYEFWLEMFLISSPISPRIY